MNADNVALGGTKFVLFNAEYYFDIAPQVRALLFHDAGQAFDENAADRPAPAAHVERRRAARHAARHRRAVPADLRLERLPRHVPAGARVQVRRRHDILTER